MENIYTGPKSKKGPNFRLLLEVLAHMVEEPERVDQNNWLCTNPKAPCGTAGCVAGWTVWLTTPKKKREALSTLHTYTGIQGIQGIPRIAKVRLRLTVTEATFLFAPTSAPSQLQVIAGRIKVLISKYAAKTRD